MAGKVASVFTAAGVIGVGWWYGSTATTATTAVVADPSTSTASPSSTSSSTTSPNSSSTSSPPPSAAATGTYTGAAESDRYGQLTVAVVAKSGKITDITYTSTAGDGRSLQIESQAVPILKSEAVAANSADIAAVSGATYTSTKYKASLQSALDKE
jgi:uncharacterized protein with FMN-binding domain